MVAMFGVLAAETASATMSVPDVLLDLLIVLAVAKGAAELAERVGIPAVVGEILAGIVIGPSAFNLVGDGDVLHFLAELGVIMLLLEVGMEMDLEELMSVGRSSLQVAVAGVVLPFAMGSVVMLSFGKDGNTALFVGAALTATSVGITARVFGDMHALATSEARTVLGAAVADDVLGLVILTVVVRIVTEGSVGPGTILEVAGVAILFLFGVGAICIAAAPPLFSGIQRISRGTGTIFTLAIAFALLISVLANESKLAPIVGAFVAGLALSRTKQVDRVRRDLSAMIHVLVPVFFVRIGIDSEVSEFKRPAVLGLAACLVAVGVVGKIAAGRFAASNAGDRILIGLGMIPRGEVGLIFAGIGLTEGVLSNDLYAALLVVVLVTTLVTPPILKVRYNRLRQVGRNVVGEYIQPEGGWLRIDRAAVGLVDTPPQDIGLVVALTAAGHLEDRIPDRALLDWLARLPDDAFTWDRESEKLLYELLQSGGPRTWRFLYTTGVLERSFPELASAIAARRADPFLYDLSGELQWPLVDAVHRYVESAPVAITRHIRHSEWLVLASLVIDVTSADNSSGQDVAKRIAQRLDLPHEAHDEIQLLVGERGLLLGASRRLDAFTEPSIEQLAIRLRHRECAASLYVLTSCYFELEELDRQRLAQLWLMLDKMLAQYESGLPELGDILQHRRDQSLSLVGDNLLARRRIDTGPMAWLLSAAPESLARQAREIYPRPDAEDLRVFAVPAEHRIDVVCRDRRGLLAAVTGAFESMAIDIESAVAATWPDGMALSSFAIRGDGALGDITALRDRIEELIESPSRARAIADVTVLADNQASPWYTVLVVEADDQPGLLHAITSAIATAEARIHSAHVSTSDAGRAVDSFEVSDLAGGKLAEEQVSVIEAAIHRGGSPLPRLRHSFLRGAW